MTMLCKGNLAHGTGFAWCLGEAGEDGLCAAHRKWPLYRPGSRGSVRANMSELEGKPVRTRGRRKSTKNPAEKSEAES
jgi:hypothetical protein